MIQMVNHPNQTEQPMEAAKVKVVDVSFRINSSYNCPNQNRSLVLGSVQLFTYSLQPRFRTFKQFLINEMQEEIYYFRSMWLI